MKRKENLNSVMENYSLLSVVGMSLSAVEVKKRKILTVFLTILFSMATLKGQNYMVVNYWFEDEGNMEIPIAINDIKQIVFFDFIDEYSMWVTTTSDDPSDDVVWPFLLDDITFITFRDDPEAIKVAPKNRELNVYLNANGEIVAESSCQINRLTVFDLNGRKLAMSAQSRLNVNFLSMGIYIIKVETAERVITKKFIKNR